LIGFSFKKRYFEIYRVVLFSYKKYF